MQLDDSVLSKLCTFIGDQTEIPKISLFNCINWKNVNFVGKSCNRVDRTAIYAVTVETNNEITLILIEYCVDTQQIKILLFVGKELIRKQSWSILSGWNHSQLLKIQKKA